MACNVVHQHTSQKGLHHGGLLGKMRSITKAPKIRDSADPCYHMVWMDGSAESLILGALVIEYLTMVTTHFPDDDMCRRKRGGV